MFVVRLSFFGANYAIDVTDSMELIYFYIVLQVTTIFQVARVLRTAIAEGSSVAGQSADDARVTNLDEER